MTDKELEEILENCYKVYYAGGNAKGMLNREVKRCTWKDEQESGGAGRSQGGIGQDYWKALHGYQLKRQ